LTIQNVYDEREIVLRLTQGDEVAFEKLYGIYSERLFGYLIKLVKSETFACELLQDAFIRIWNSRANINPEQSFRSYLFRIAENLVYDLFRKAARDKKLQDELIRSASSYYSHVEENFLSKEDVQLLHNVIEALPPQRRQVFQLIKLEGRTYSEVSQILNISVSTISDHIVKATKFIRQQLESKHAAAVGLLAFCLFS
jgi:RNA polymerase sigma-70 factor (family 1)